VFEGDDHNAPSITRLANGKLLAVYTRHAQDHLVRYRISSEPDSIASWGPEHGIHSNWVTYSQAWVDSGGRVHLFYRTTSQSWAHRFSDDDAVTWSNEKLFIATVGGHPYIATMPDPANPDVVRLAVAAHPINASDHNIYYAEIDLESGDIGPPGAEAATNLYDASAPVTPAAFETVFDSPSQGGVLTRMLDLGAGAAPQILFATFTGTDDAQYREARRGNGEWIISDEIAPAGPPIENPVGANYYFAGMAATADNDELYLARRDSSTADWPLERYRRVGGAWVLDEVLMRGDWRLYSEVFRPMTPYQAGTQVPVIALRGSYEYFATTAGHRDHNTAVVLLPGEEPQFIESVLYQESFAALTVGAPIAGYSVLTKSSGATGEAVTTESGGYFGGKYGRFIHGGAPAVLWGIDGVNAQDVVMRSDFRAVSPATSVHGFVCRWADSNNRLELLIRFVTAPTLQIRERVGGSYQDANQSILGVAHGDALTLEFSVQGASAVGRVYQNGVLVGEVEKALTRPPAPGAAGFHIDSGAAGAASVEVEVQRLLITAP